MEEEEVTTTLSIFRASDNELDYHVDIKSPKLFNLLVGNVSNGASFRAAAANWPV
ncbi:hypothetical protein L917_18511 [Phytophthora nicotianae]|uniref:Uncharacterized protein n=1 Tax=Phytophthora nicotianae TaxID=4792 RepID=W2K959_PHYNI|nr:hypothetical protein L917_18511 [Phytophthora nicotianae]